MYVKTGTLISMELIVKNATAMVTLMRMQSETVTVLQVNVCDVLKTQLGNIVRTVYLATGEML